MRSNIASYESSPGGTIQIVYQAGDNHIRMLVAGQDERWRDEDITRTAGGPELEAPIITAYTWTTGRTQQIEYVSSMSDGRIHELVALEDHPWSYEDLMDQHTGAPPSDGVDIVGYSWEAGGTKHVVYTAADGHIHELSAGVSGPWHYTNLTQAAGAHQSEGRIIAAYPWDAQKTRQVVYLGDNGHIHELVANTEGSWSHQDLTALASAPLAEPSALSAYVWQTGNTKQVVYLGANGDIYELAAGADGQWRYSDLTALAGAPLAAGSALASFAWETGQGKQVVYVGNDRHVHELALEQNGKWKHTDLTQHVHAPEAADDVIVGLEWSAQFAKQIIYLDRNANPHIHSLLFKHGASWKHTDLTNAAGAEPLV